MATLLDFLEDKQAQKDIGRGLLDAANRGAVAGLLGGPVDIATMALRPLGYSVEKPAGGSEWIGQKFQDWGVVSDQRNPIAETLAGVALPAAAYQLAPKLFAAEQALMQNAFQPSPINASTRNQSGMLRLANGRIPENRSDVNLLAEQLATRARAAGNEVNIEKSAASPSTYLSIHGPSGAHGEVRFADHADFHPGMGGGARISVDPDSLKSYEDAVKFLSERGVTISRRAPSVNQAWVQSYVDAGYGQKDALAYVKELMKRGISPPERFK